MRDQGLVPSLAIESGMETERLFKERGWTHWNHLFNARQLFLLNKIYQYIIESSNHLNLVAGLLGLNKCIDWNSRLCRWNGGIG